MIQRINKNKFILDVFLRTKVSLKLVFKTKVILSLLNFYLNCPVKIIGLNFSRLKNIQVQNLNIYRYKLFI